MKANAVGMRTFGSAPSAWSVNWSMAPVWARCFGVAGAVLAFGLLCGFYVVVAGAVHRSENGRELARVSLERQAACSVFSTASSRDLCTITVAAHAMPYGLEPRQGVARGIVQASLRETDWRSRRPQLVSELY